MKIRTNRPTLKLYSALCGLVSLCYFFTTALSFALDARDLNQVDHSAISPYWTQDDYYGEGTHRSRLDDVNTIQYEVRPRDVMDHELAQKLGLDWIELNRQYEDRKVHSLVTQQEEADHIARVKDFTRNVLSELRTYHVQQNLKRARENAEKDETLKALAKTFGWVAALVGFYQGETVKFNVSDSSKISAKMSSKTKRGLINFESPAINTSADFLAGSPAAPATTPGTLPLADPLAYEERYNLSASRGLPIFQLASGVSYAGTSQKMTAYLSREIIPNVTGIVDSSRKLNPDNQLGTPAQAAFRVLYNVHF